MPPVTGAVVELAASLEAKEQGVVQRREDTQISVGWECGCRNGRLPWELLKHACRHVTVSVKETSLWDLPLQQCPQSQ